MAKMNISGPREPMDKGSTVGQIVTSMCAENVQRNGGGKVHSFANTFNDGGKSGSSSIVGPGVKGQYPIKAPKTTKL